MFQNKNVIKRKVFQHQCGFTQTDTLLVEVSIVLVNLSNNLALCSKVEDRQALWSSKIAPRIIPKEMIPLFYQDMCENVNKCQIMKTVQGPIKNRLDKSRTSHSVEYHISMKWTIALYNNMDDSRKYNEWKSKSQLNIIVKILLSGFEIWKTDQYVVWKYPHLVKL